MTAEEIRQTIREWNPQALMLGPEFDSAIVGMSCQHGGNPLVIYDPGKIIEVLAGMGMDEEEASEFFSFNIECAYMGPHTPAMLHRIEVE
jgi:hypothetical protein